MRRQRSDVVRVGAATFGVVVAAGFAFVAPANAATPADMRAAAPSRTAVSRHIVTLLTSDVVILERSADGRQATTVRPPADRQQIAYQTRQVDGHAYVIPSDAVPLLAAGKLDQELFDVTQLVADEYDDEHAATTPLIVQFAQTQMKAQAAPTLPGATRRFTLDSINATAVRERKSEAAWFWTSLVGSPLTEAKASATADAISRIWLDGKAKVSLADSVPQIGAPQAWAAGHDGAGVKVAVLDTGIDAIHPDLADKVVAAQNFSTDTDTLDHFGHGTHVASIVAGTGTASNGLRKGVAPGASLINAKVLNAFGSGDFSSIIQGMEWAAAQGAKVANMSLGTHSPSDGNDPLVQAVNQISRSTGILFAIAADNIGPRESTITSPGWADDALTVGAVDKRNVLAGFSSRGPRLGDYGIKPDITAPGVDIIAARAAGTNIGPIVDGQYTQLSGTSMAAPHVAGAAAILAQEHPTYTNQQLKNLLISTAKTADYTVYQQGGGRVDVARAHSQQVYASPATLNLGYFPYPHTDQQPVSKTVTYRNGGSTDVTLSLSLDVRGRQGTPAPAGMFAVSQPSVTVPASGEAAITVTVNPAGGPFDLYGGYLVGAAGDAVVHTSIGAYVEAEMYNVTVPAIAHDGRQADGISQVELWGPAIQGFQTKYYRGGVTPTFRVPPGTYSLMGYIFTMDAPNSFALQAAVVGEPQLHVTRDATVTLDARPAKKIVTDTPNPSAPLDLQIAYHRALGGFTFDSSFLLGTPIDEAYAVPTEQVTEGDFEFWSKWTLIAPPILMSVVKPQRITLDPLFMINSPTVDGTHKLPMVYASFGRPADYAGLDVRGKIALIQRGAGVTFHDKVVNAANAGAAAAIVFNNRPGLLFAFGGAPGTVPIPSFTIDQEPGLMLVDLLQQGPVTVEYSGTSLSTYEYDLMLPNPQRIASNQTYVINDKNTARFEVDYHGNADRATGSDVKFALRPYSTFLFGGARTLVRPLHRTEWVTAAPDIWWWHLVWAHYPFDGEFDSTPTSYPPNRKFSESWFGQVARPGIPVGLTGWEDAGAPAYREGDQFTMQIFPYVDPEQHYGWGWSGDVASTKLYQGNQLLADRTYAIGSFPAVPGSATYRLVSEQKRSAPWWKYSTDITTTWTFHSATPASGRQLLPLLQVDYHLPLDLLNQASDSSTYAFTLGVGHQPGVAGPDIETVQAWVSFDDGATWREINLIQLGNGALLATMQHPKMASASGAVSLRVKATDAVGNSIDQTIVRAYGLRPAS